LIAKCINNPSIRNLKNSSPKIAENDATKYGYNGVESSSKSRYGTFPARIDLEYTNHHPSVKGANDRNHLICEIVGIKTMR
jgi:hypothetical protein